MKARVLLVAVTCAIVITEPRSLNAQMVSANASQLMPHGWGEANTKSSRDRGDAIDASRFIALYAAPFLGVPGTMLDTAGIVDTKSPAYHFPSVHFVVSAAARIQPGGGETRTNRALKRLNAHIRIDALDSQQQLITDRAAIEVLEIQPNTQKYDVAVQDSSTVHGAVSMASRTLMEDAIESAGRRIKPILAAFKNVFHHPDTPTQVSYVSDHNEFGWTWYEHPDKTLEGVHNTAVLIETRADVRYLMVRIDVITDWGPLGGWTRRFESVIDLGPGS